MTDIRVVGSRVFADTGIGLIARKDELALLDFNDFIGLAITGTTTGGEAASATMTGDGRLRVETGAGNPFAGSPWSGRADLFTSSKSAW